MAWNQGYKKKGLEFVADQHVLLPKSPCCIWFIKKAKKRTEVLQTVSLDADMVLCKIRSRESWRSKRDAGSVQERLTTFCHKKRKLLQPGQSSSGENFKHNLRLIRPPRLFEGGQVTLHCAWTLVLETELKSEWNLMGGKKKNTFLNQSLC